MTLDLHGKRVLLIKSKRLARDVAGIVDGGTAHVYYVARGLTTRGADVHAVVRAEDDTSVTSATLPYTAVHEVATGRSQKSAILVRDWEDGHAFVQAIPQAILTDYWDAVHVHHWSSAVGLVPRLPAHARVVYTPHLLAIEKAAILGEELPPQIAAVERDILLRADAIVCLSTDEARAVERHYGVSGDHVRVVPNGAGASGTERLEVCRRPGVLRITSIGRLVRQKGYDVLLDALHMLDADAAAKTRVRLVGPSYGEHEFERVLRERAARCDVPVAIEGPIAHDRVRELLAETDLYVQPSRYESQGIALQEAMSAGLAVVATRIPAIQEYLIDGENALVVPAEDPHSLAEAITRLAHDDRLREALGRAARATTCLASWDAVVPQNIQIVLGVSS